MWDAGRGTTRVDNLPVKALDSHRMDMRIRVPELLDERIPTAYAIAKASGGRISMSAAHRLVRLRGKVRRMDADLLDALADVFQVKSLDDLLERGHRRRSA